ncbi:MAG: hypothetical protein QOF59_1226 [Actinomycetota bacterium]|nr:hypothetical protein [Actinomycetota bacterium]
MNTTGTTDAATGMDGRPLWAIAAYDDGAGRVPWAVSHSEIERAMGGACSTLAGLGVRGGARALWCPVLSESAHFWPLMIGTMLNGGVFSLADATAADALRVAMFARSLQLQSVFGVNEAILDGLDELGIACADLFAGVEIVGAHPGAYERLVAAGLAPYWFVLCGPAVAIATEPGGPARVDATEWSLASDGDRILVSNLQPRAQEFERAPTRIRGRLVDASGFVPHPTGTVPHPTGEM